jgi:hypothetical protein
VSGTLPSKRRLISSAPNCAKPGSPAYGSSGLPEMDASLPLTLGAYWGPRHEDAESCSWRLARWLTVVSSISPQLRPWRVRDEASRTLYVPGVSAGLDVVDFMRGGTHRNDIDGRPMPDMGFTVGAWAGAKQCPVMMLLTCGTNSRWAQNALVLNLPRPQAPCAGDLYELMTAKQLVGAAVSAWDPDWVSVFNIQWDEDDRLVKHGVRPGWLTYIKNWWPRQSQDWPKLESVGTGSMVLASERLVDLDEARMTEVAKRIARR